MEDLVHIKRALVSVWDKNHLEQLASLFKSYGIEVISTGRTAQYLKKYGVKKILEVSDYTKSPEILGGRVKTLHPKIYAGILYRRDLKQDEADLRAVGSLPIDLVVVNLYPFKDAYLKGEEDLVEFIDIGGPTLLRAAAKNFKWTTVISSPEDYLSLEKELTKNSGATSLPFRRKMARYVFSLTSAYDAWIHSVLFKDNKIKIEDNFLCAMEKILIKRQIFTFYQGKKLSLPNYGVKLFLIII